MQMRYSYPIIQNSDQTKIDQNENLPSVYVENSESIFSDLILDETVDEGDFESMRRDTVSDLHKSELMYSVEEKSIEIADFDLV